MSDTCPVCRSKVSDAKDVSLRVFGLDAYCYSCPRCGDYQIQSITGKEVKDLGLAPEETAALSHWIRTRHESNKKQRTKETISLTKKLVDDIIKNRPPSITEQKNKLVLWLGDNSLPGRSVPVNADIDQSIIGAITSDGFLLVLDWLADAGLVTQVVVGSSSGRALTYKGWEYYEELRRGTINSRTAFMAMEYANKQLTDVFENVFKDAVDKTGFDLRRLVDTPQPAGLIDDDLRVKIRAARFLVADLTDRNPGAYWEAGYAEGLGKPVIYTCKKGVFEDSKSCPHFDTNHHLTILWDISNPQEAGEKLKATIRATLPAEAKLTDDRCPHSL
jgi:hypothetical protein